MTLHTHTLRALTVAAAISALAAPTASAIPVEEFMQGGRADSDSLNRAVPVRIFQVEADTGFDWGDAGLGATGALALAAMCAGAAVATGHRPRLGHSPQPSR